MRLSVMLTSLLTSLMLLGACSPSSRTLPQAHPAARSEARALPAALAAMNAERRRQGVQQSVAGLRIDDPYRALEHDGAQTQAWIAAQTERTEQALAALRDPAAEARLQALLSIGTFGEVAMGGSRVFFTLREAGRERPALYVMDSRASPAAAVPSLPIVDPTSYGPSAAIDYIFPSPDGHYVAFGSSDNGDERATLRIYDVDKARVLGEALAHAKWSSVSWLHDGSGFYYSRYPRAGEPDYDDKDQDSYFARLFLHRMDEPQASDRLVFSGKAGTDFPSATLDPSDRYLAITNYRSWTASDVWLWDRGREPAAGVPTSADLQAVVHDEDKNSSALLRGGQLYLATNLEAPRKRIVRVDPAHAADRSRWQLIVPESSATLEDWTATDHSLVVHYIDDLRSRIQLFTLDGKPLGEVPLPTRGSVSELAASPTGERISFVFSSYFQPPTLYDYDLGSRALSCLHQVPNDVDTSRFELEQARVKSLDGTEINVDYAHLRGLARNGNNPVLLSGYGGFDVSLLPEFSRTAQYWMERGGIYAQANLRGGGEYGEAWHRAGMLENKHHVFEDFEAAIRWFSHSGWSRPARIAITGGSNGGLLMGAMITRAPESFAAAASYVGLYDMLRYARFPPAGLWTTEYGDPEQPRAAAYLRAYSPYHNVHDGTAYPAVLLETADHDTRVFWGHSAKFAARLQEATTGPRPIYFYMERSVGHGRGTALADLVRRYARQYAFLSQALGLGRAQAR
jgi:prolyl oligopeptidase